MSNLEIDEIQTLFETRNQEIVKIVVFRKDAKKMSYVIIKNNNVHRGEETSNFINIEECLKYIVDSNGFMVYMGSAKRTDKYTLTDHIKLSILKEYKGDSEQEAYVIKNGKEEIFRKNYPCDTDIDSIIKEIIDTLHIRNEVDAYKTQRFNQ